MIKINALVTKYNKMILDEINLVSGSENEYEINFNYETFTNWKNVKTLIASFKLYGYDAVEAEVINDKVIIPTEALQDVGKLGIALKGIIEGDNKSTKNTNYGIISVVRGA